MTLENKFKLARNHLGKTQEEMANALNISKGGLQSYEMGKSIPGGNVFKALSELGFNVSWFFNDDVPMLSGAEFLNTSTHNQHTENTNIPSDNIGLGESVELLAKIYSSGNKVLIRAIAANLQAFSEAVDNKSMATDMIDKMNKRMLALESELQNIKRENSRLDTDAEEQSLNKKVA